MDRPAADGGELGAAPNAGSAARAADAPAADKNPATNTTTRTRAKAIIRADIAESPRGRDPRTPTIAH
jgi:hypothetical protein